MTEKPMDEFEADLGVAITELPALAAHVTELVDETLRDLGDLRELARVCVDDHADQFDGEELAAAREALDYIDSYIEESFGPDTEIGQLFPED